MNYSNQTNQSELVLTIRNMKNSNHNTKSGRVDSKSTFSALKSSFRSVVETVKKESPSLYWIVIAHFAFAIVCIPGLMIDERTLLGVNVWIKPLKLPP